MNDLSSLNPRNRFSERAADYARYRPAYPAAAIDWILAGLAPASKLRIADIGAGTGISSRLLADRGAQVVAIDPNPEMLTTAKRHTRVRFVTAAAESTGLPARSVHAVVCFQAFHWFARDACMAEFRRILKPGGRFAAVWNNHDRSDPFCQAYRDLISGFGEEAAIMQRGGILSPVDATLSTHGFVRVERRVFAHFHRMDLEGFIGYARSCSYLPREGADYERLRTGLAAIYREYADAGGYVVFPYKTEVYRGDAAPAAHPA